MCAAGRRRISCKSKQADQNTLAWFLPARVGLQPCEEMAKAFAPFLAFLALLFLPPLLFFQRPASQEEDTLRRPSPGKDGSWQASLSPPLSDNPITSLAALAAFPPPVPASPTCRPVPLPSHPTCNDTAFSGHQLQKKRISNLTETFRHNALNIVPITRLGQ